MNIHAIEGAEEDAYRYNPWRAPGYAPVADACGFTSLRPFMRNALRAFASDPCACFHAGGLAGGKGPHQGIGGDSSFTTTPLATMGDLGSRVLKPSANKTQWKAGTSVEVAWGIRYNHGGGCESLKNPPSRLHPFRSSAPRVRVRDCVAIDARSRFTVLCFVVVQTNTASARPTKH